MINFGTVYNRAIFETFLKNFLPEDFVVYEKAKDIHNVTRYNKITDVKILGESKTLGLEVLEILHDSENDPRITLTTSAFKILKDMHVGKALIVFRSNNSEQYRLSYLTATLTLSEDGKIVRGYSNTRRYSFLLGQGAKVNTPTKQLIEKGRVTTPKDILDRFSLEVVNNPFYDAVAKHFRQLVDESSGLLELPLGSVVSARRDFAVRLIGRMVFCWFLKQKKTSGGQLVPDSILSSVAIKKNYYHEALEPLFFQALNIPIDERVIRTEEYDKVPYLNGGLFNQQKEDYYSLDKDTYASKFINTLKVSDEWFKSFFELLETYNFTIDENTSIDQELSVDPEMLGQIFERLLGEINPETGGNDRKATGSFYTPRPIVEYMVDTSLREYLKGKTGIDEEKLAALISYDLEDDKDHELSPEEKVEVVTAIETLTVLDPACGSGAFPIGVLQKIVWVLQVADQDCKIMLDRQLANVSPLVREKIRADIEGRSFDYTRKYEVIRKSIFGVDIQPLAVEISRLRCFLTLVVEAEIDDSKPNRGLIPLPNLDFKFTSANTLIGLPKRADTDTKALFEDHTGIEELSEIMKDYFTANRSEREILKNRFHNKQKEIFTKMISMRAVGDLTATLASWDPFENKSTPWFESDWMFGLEEKFDIVIGNPPYQFLSGRGSPVRKLEAAGDILGAKHLKDYFMLLSVMYPEVSRGGLDYYKWFIRVAANFTIEDGVFSYITPNTYLTLKSYADVRDLLFKENKTLRVLDLGFHVFDVPMVPTAIFISKRTKGTEFSTIYSDFKSLNADDLKMQNILETSNENSLSVKYEDGKLSLYKHTLAEKLYLIAECTLEKYLRISEGEHGLKNDFSVIFSEGVPVIYDKKIISYTYPEIRFLPVSYCPKYSKDLHVGKRIVIRKTGDSILAVPIETDDLAITHQNMYVGLLKDGVSKEYVVGILSSKLLTFLYQNGIYGQKGRAMAQFRIYGLYELPVPKITPQNQKTVSEIETLVTQILTLKKQNSQSDAKSLETQIDNLVYQLYSLTPDEIKIIEEKI